VQFTHPTTARDLIRRDFELRVDARCVPGTLTLRADASPRAIVIAGHGFMLSRRTPFPATLEADLARRDVGVVGLDAPGNGDRQPDGGRDRALVDRAWRAHWRQHAAEEIAQEHRALIAALAEAGYGDRPLGYWGLSLATQYGVGILAAEPRIRAAVLGLSALPDPGPRIAAYAERVSCPVFFILQEGDTIAVPGRARALFERIGSREKVLRASAGGHTDVPSAVFEEGYRFLQAHLLDSAAR